MSSVQLLDKTRKIGKLLHNNKASKVVFNDICEVLKEILQSNVLVISAKGKLLGIGNRADIHVIDELLQSKVGRFVDGELNDRFLSVLSTKENVNLQTLGFDKAGEKSYTALISPIEIAGERLGTLFIYKMDNPYQIDDIILCEYGTTVVGLEMLRSVTEESAEEVRRREVVDAALDTLSNSEMEAVAKIFAELKTKEEDILVASRIADSLGITRSVIVNAIRKLQSAGVIESHSSGMKGTKIRVLNDYIYEKLGI